MNHAAEFESIGYTRFPFDERLARWAKHAALTSPSILADPQHDKWWRHGRTWFVGVDALPNNETGALADGPPLQGMAIDFIQTHLKFESPWHRGQLSVCYPSYPLRDAGESETQHKFRLTRDAAHVDGLHAEGAGKRRHFREAHQFILGIPLNHTTDEDAPLVVWEGSHHIMREAFERTFAGTPVERWSDLDVTEPYQEARRRCFAECHRTRVHALPGECYVVHRHALHGVAPWASSADGCRMIAYFRPAALSPIAIGR